MKTLLMSSALIFAAVWAGAASPSIQVQIPPEAIDWTPVSVRVASTGQKSITFKKNGKSSKAAASGGVYAVGEEKIFIVAVYPDSLLSMRTHFEVRFSIAEGFMEKAEMFAVTVDNPADVPAGKYEDSRTLRSKGVSFQEQTPASAQVMLEAFNLRNGFNQGGASKAVFGDRRLGTVEFTWVTGKSPEFSLFKGPFGCDTHIPPYYKASTAATARAGGKAVVFHPTNAPANPKAITSVLLEMVPVFDAAANERRDLAWYAKFYRSEFEARRMGQVTTNEYKGKLSIIQLNEGGRMVHIQECGDHLYIFSGPPSAYSDLSGRFPFFALAGGLKDAK